MAGKRHKPEEIVAKLRQVDWSKWFQWTGTHWEHENTLGVAMAPLLFYQRRSAARFADARARSPRSAFKVRNAYDLNRRGGPGTKACIEPQRRVNLKSCPGALRNPRGSFPP